MIKARSAAAVVAAALLLTACSSSSSSSTAASSPATSSTSSTAGTDAATYADTVCTQLTTWQQAIKDDSATFQQAVQGATSPADVKTALEDFLTTTVDNTQQMVDQINAAGAPAVDGGQDAQAAMVQALTSVVTLFQTALDDVKAIDTTDQAGMAAALQGIAKDLQTGSKDVQQALTGLKNSGLDTAFADASSCAAFK